MKVIAGFITGHSVPGCTGLSRVQRDFLDGTQVPESCRLEHNFPWIESPSFPGKISLATASWNNVRHCLASLGTAFRRRHRDEVIARFDPFDAVVLLAGSCGLELLDNLDLPGATRERMHVFAYGPVSRRIPRVGSVWLVQGNRDFISRAIHRRVDHVVPCGHLDYLETPGTLALFDEFYRRVTSS